MIRIEQLSFRIGDFALKNVSLEIAQGEYFVLLGPPGSGKSILLECLCGLNAIDRGRIDLGRREVTRLEPRNRGIGYVPQDYALFPHLSVENNIAFGLRVAGMAQTEIRIRVEDTAGMLGIQHLLKRRTPGLSGGERQRVALARALVLHPQVLLLDEPVSALDESTRQEVCEQLRLLHYQMNLTTVHVSHNQEEAFSIADRAGILDQGQLIQTGTMEQLLRRPTNEFIARFMRCENILQATTTAWESNQTMVQCGAVSLRIPGHCEGRVTMMIRPEDIRVLEANATIHPAANVFAGKVVRARDYGNHVRMTLEGGLHLVANLPHQEFAKLGAQPPFDITVILPTESIYVFD